LFENTIANQLKEYGTLSYYNQRKTAEIDFILNKEVAFEVKINATAKDLKRTTYLAEKLGINETYLISRKYNETERTIFPMFL
jgi:uncharacterized protein